MRVLVLTNTMYSLPALEFMRKNLWSPIVISPLSTSDDAGQLKHWCFLHRLEFEMVEESNLESNLCFHLSDRKPAIVLVFGFPWKVPEVILHTPICHSYNIHFSLLPAYAGPIPVFWQIRNGDTAGGVTIHKLSAKFDAGPVVSFKKLAIHPGETTGLFSGRLSYAAVDLVAELLLKFRNGGNIISTLQNDDNRTYNKRPCEKDITIDWEKDDAASIENLVNACNPVAGGAISYFKGRLIQIIEVTPADADTSYDAPAGTIIYSDASHGLFVICCDRNVLRINIVRIPEGIVSGTRLSVLGFAMGERFTTDQFFIQSKQPSFSYH